MEVSGEPKNVTECLSNLHHEAVLHIPTRERWMSRVGDFLKPPTVQCVGHGGSFTAEVSDSERLRTPKVELGLFPYVY